MDMIKTMTLTALLGMVGVTFMGFAPTQAQVPIDEYGTALESIDAAKTIDALKSGDAAVTTPLVLGEAELEDLVGPVALYPDELLAIVLPASTYPMQIVMAARFLDALETDSSLKPDKAWDDSIIALLNYPEVVRMMDEDLDWTRQLGDAVLDQQTEVIAAVERFRDRAYAAGNLKSDNRQVVSNDNGIIEIDPVEDDVIYVPYYEPERVVVYQTTPVYYYYPRAYPVYYYPYPMGYSFSSGYFWGLTSAFHLSWSDHYLSVFHHSYRGHPYYGHHYNNYYYRRPDISVHNYYYGDYQRRDSRNWNRDGDIWQTRNYDGSRYGERRQGRDFDRRREPHRDVMGSRRNRGAIPSNDVVDRTRLQNNSGPTRNATRETDTNAEPAATTRTRNSGPRREGRRSGGREGLNRTNEREPSTTTTPRSGNQRNTEIPATAFRERPERHNDARAVVPTNTARRDARRQREIPATAFRDRAERSDNAQIVAAANTERRDARRQREIPATAFRERPERNSATQPRTTTRRNAGATARTYGDYERPANTRTGSQSRREDSRAIIGQRESRQSARTATRAAERRPVAQSARREAGSPSIQQRTTVQRDTNVSQRRSSAASGSAIQRDTRSNRSVQRSERRAPTAAPVRSRPAQAPRPTASRPQPQAKPAATKSKSSASRPAKKERRSNRRDRD